MPAAEVVVACCLVVGVASFTQTVTGFGFALVLVPVAAGLLGPEAGIGLTTALGIVSNAIVALTLRAHVETGVVGRVVAAAVVGAPLGLVLLVRLPATTIKVLIAASVLAAVVVLWRRPVLHRRGHTHALELGAGFVSGALATSTGANGPPVVLAVQAREEPPDVFRATLSTTFALINTAVLVWFVATDQLEWEVMPIVPLALPAMALGWWVGSVVHRRIPPERFRSVVLALLAASAVVSVVLALT